MRIEGKGREWVKVSRLYRRISKLKVQMASCVKDRDYLYSILANKHFLDKQSNILELRGPSRALRRQRPAEQK